MSVGQSYPHIVILGDINKYKITYAKDGSGQRRIGREG